ncbi:hypothetical protein PoB_007596500 [Plakobranchus ocellatus]|uniref:Uncharacterized protein n=1 Tax=Plakobranchus ocellatus TaxID=259542 RepID=A0AAV4DZM6_9GAST|nr:hypothetical protein PoB_007596500 [Plakobranchus ocellatus]
MSPSHRLWHHSIVEFMADDDELPEASALRCGFLRVLSANSIKIFGEIIKCTGRYFVPDIKSCLATTISFIPFSLQKLHWLSNRRSCSRGVKTQLSRTLARSCV